MELSDTSERDRLAVELKSELGIVFGYPRVPPWVQTHLGYERGEALGHFPSVVRPFWNGIVELLRSEGYSAVRARLDDLRNDAEAFTRLKNQFDGQLRLVKRIHREVLILREECSAGADTPIGISAGQLYADMTGDLWNELYERGWTVEGEGFRPASGEQVGHSQPERFYLSFAPTKKMVESVGLNELADDKYLDGLVGAGGLYNFVFNHERTWEQAADQVRLRASPLEDRLHTFEKTRQLAIFQVSLVQEVLYEERMLGRVQCIDADDESGNEETEPTPTLVTYARALVNAAGYLRRRENGQFTYVINEEWELGSEGYRHLSDLFGEMSLLDGMPETGDSVRRTIRRWIKDGVTIYGHEWPPTGGEVFRYMELARVLAERYPPSTDRQDI